MTSAARLSLRYAGLSEVGGRTVNQDAWRIAEAPDGHWCVVLADGLGGHDGGEVAAEVAVAAVTRAFDEAPEVSAVALERYVHHAHAHVQARQQAEAHLDQMRTTLVVLALDTAAGQAAWTHIGDSRLYHLRRGRIRAQTRDHSVPQALVAAGDLDARAIRTHPDRNRLLRSLGPEDPRPDVEPPRALEDGDAFLLCSDGFWDYVTEPEMEVDFAKARAPEHWLDLMTDRLLLRAHEPQHDNYTAVALFVEGTARG